MGSIYTVQDASLSWRTSRKEIRNNNNDNNSVFRCVLGKAVGKNDNYLNYMSKERIELLGAIDKCMLLRRNRSLKKVCMNKKWNGLKKDRSKRYPWAVEVVGAVAFLFYWIIFVIFGVKYFQHCFCMCLIILHMCGSDSLNTNESNNYKSIAVFFANVIASRSMRAIKGVLHQIA